MLINNDKYIAIGKEPKLLSTLTSSLRLVAKESKGKGTLSLQKQTLRNIIELEGINELRERSKKQKEEAGEKVEVAVTEEASANEEKAE